MSRLPAVSLLLVAFAAVASVRPAQAAPQILALLETPEPVPLTCEDGICRAQLTTLCLQRHRDPPAPGTAYRPRDADDLRLITVAGESHPLGAIAGAEIRSSRSYTVVEVVVPAADLGAGAVLAVAADASLLPVAVAGDPDPLDAEEVAYVTGPLRAAAARRLATARASKSHHAAMALGRLTNVLPARGRVASDIRERLWQENVAPYAERYGPAGMERGETIFRSCLDLVGRGRYFSLRNCLELRHDSLMLDVNSDVWRAIEPGT